MLKPLVTVKKQKILVLKTLFSKEVVNGPIDKDIAKLGGRHGRTHDHWLETRIL
ncbi:hypothetical protein [Peribacillus sp. NPDC096540]|uniref:hypothetical protein n=1 Tax=Peribacillus sp. NPDC096540 TaxID=3390612 RepID=UPI003CFCB0F8